MTPPYKLITLENVIGLFIAILIIFDLSLEEPLINALNHPFGLFFSCIILIILLITMHPVIGILFAIYVYQNIQSKSNHSGPYSKKKDQILEQLNPPTQMQVEELVILERAPIKKEY